jgi:hypothetical protein
MNRISACESMIISNAANDICDMIGLNKQRHHEIYDK